MTSLHKLNRARALRLVREKERVFEKSKPFSLFGAFRRWASTACLFAFAATGIAAPFTNTTTSGLVLWVDAEDILGTGNPNPFVDGTNLPMWQDKSGQGNHFANLRGDPSYVAVTSEGNSGMPAVYFDGNDGFWTNTNFESLLSQYTILSVARYSGGQNNRLISCRSRNWLFGFHASKTKAWHFEGWVYQAGGADTSWHLHVADIDNAGDPNANTWYDGTQLATNNRGSNNNNYKPDQIQLGGWKTNSEFSQGEVAELLVFNRVLTSDERLKLEGHLAHKWGLAGTLPFSHPWKNNDPYPAGVKPVIGAPVTTSSSPIPLTVDFQLGGTARDVTGFQSTDLSVTNGTVSNFSGSGSSYSFDLTPSSDPTTCWWMRTRCSSRNTTNPIFHAETTSWWISLPICMARYVWKSCNALWRCFTNCTNRCSKIPSVLT